MPLLNTLQAVSASTCLCLFVPVSVSAVGIHTMEAPSLHPVSWPIQSHADSCKRYGATDVSHSSWDTKEGVSHSVCIMCAPLYRTCVECAPLNMH